jgi:hypothetical protein
MAFEIIKKLGKGAEKIKNDRLIEIGTLIDEGERAKKEREEKIISENLTPPEEQALTDKIAEIETHVKNLTRERDVMTKGVVETLLGEYELSDKLPDGFKELEPQQKLFVIENTKKRVIDIVKLDAETQYSSYLKKKLQNAAPKGFFGKITKALKNVGKSSGAAAAKEHKLKNLESQAFKELYNTEEGRKLVEDNLNLLTKTAQERNIVEADGKPTVVFISPADIENCTSDEKRTVRAFQKAANAFRNVPYEWGQGKGKNKKQYDKAKKEYEIQRGAILNIKTKRETPDKKGRSMLEMGQMDAMIHMDQLLNTHPEFEQELERLGNTAGGQETLAKLGKVGKAASGKDWRNRGIIVLGGVIRWGTKLGAYANMSASAASGTTFGVSTVVGGALGWFKGKIKAKQELGKKEKGARHIASSREMTGMLAQEIADKKVKLKGLTEPIDTPEILDIRKKLKDATDADDKGLMKILTQSLNGLLKAELEKFKKGPDYANNQKSAQALIKDLKILEAQRDQKRNAEMGNFSSIIKLTAQLDGLMKQIETLTDDEKRVKTLAMLAHRIEYSMNKVASGQVNFGDAKSFTVNQFNYITALNKAIAVNEANLLKIDTKITDTIKNRLAVKSKEIAEGTQKARDVFIRKQQREGVIRGAGLAMYGYTLRWVGEYIGLFDGYHGVHHDGGAEKPAIDVSDKTVSPEIIKQQADSALDAQKTAELLKNQEDSFQKLKTVDSIRDAADQTKAAEILKQQQSDSVRTPELEKTKLDPTKNVKLEEKPKIDTSNANKDIPGTKAKVLKDEQAAKLKLETEQKAATIKTQIEETIDGAKRGPTVNFSVTLGKDGVPPNLETAFNEISADRLNIPIDGVVSEEMAAKSLNMAANMTELNAGHDVVGVSADEFKKAVNFDPKTGILEIKDHAKFNEIVASLKGKADESWNSGILKSKGGAASYIRNISKDSWVKIMHADGLTKTPEGIETGINGHQEVTADKIGNFGNTNIGKEAVDVSDNLKGSTTMSEEYRRMHPDLGSNNIQSNPDPADLKYDKDEYLRMHPNQKPDSIQINPAQTDTEIFNQKEYDRLHPDNLPHTLNTSSQISKEAFREMSKVNIDRIFLDNRGAWEAVRNSMSAEDMLAISNEEAEQGAYGSLVTYMNHLRELTGLTPEAETLIKPAESISDYIARALQRAQEIDRLDEVTV